MLRQAGTTNDTLRGKEQEKNTHAINIVPMEQIGQLYFNQLKRQVPK
jgi:hypothetical protein